MLLYSINLQFRESSPPTESNSTKIFNHNQIED